VYSVLVVVVNDELGGEATAGLEFEGGMLYVGLDIELPAALVACNVVVNDELGGEATAGLEFEGGTLYVGLDVELPAALVACNVVVLYTVLVLVVLSEAGGTVPPVAIACAAAEEGEDEIAEEDNVAKISFCAPSLNPHLLLYAGLLGWPLWSVPLTTILFPSA